MAETEDQIAATVSSNDGESGPTPEQKTASDAIINARNGGMKQRAYRLARDAVGKWPDEPVFLRLAGAAAFEAEEFEDAEIWLTRLVEKAPRDGRGYLRLGEVLRRALRLPEAATAFARARAAGLVDEGLEFRIAEVANAMGDAAAAAAAYRRAHEINPSNTAAAYGMAAAARRHGDRETVLDGVARTLATDPDHAAAHRLRAEAITFSSPGPEIDAMTEALARAEKAGKLQHRIQLSFALAKAHDDLDERDKAFGFWDAGNRLKHSTFNYDMDAEEALAASARKAFNNDLSVRFHGQGLDTDVPIFVVGMSGAGTTLIEQILAGHPDVFGAGETPYLPHIAMTPMPDHRARKRHGLEYKGDAVAKKTAGGVEKRSGPDVKDIPYPDFMRDIPLERFNKRATLCFERLRALAPEARRIVDKLPVNFLYLGIIRFAFPKAKIVNCVRDPVDTCFAAWRRLYDGQQFFTYDLTDLRRFHGIYRDMMTHWHGMMPGAIHDVSYEDLIADPETTVRELFDFADLSWDDRCLRFHETPRIVDTPAGWQVRRPLDPSRVGAWKRYETYLKPFADALSADIGTIDPAGNE